MSREMDEPQVGPLPLQTLHRSLTPVRRAVVHDPELPIGGGVGFLIHHLLDQRTEGFDACLGLAAPEEPGAMNIPGSPA